MSCPKKKIVDKTNKIIYAVGAFLGQGAFGRCYEIIDKNRNKLAVKTILKASLKTKDLREKFQLEVRIHSNLNHENIVKFVNYFDDETHAYILLEICQNKSMREMMRRRRTLTLTETRYFTRQISLACQYLHEQLIIHRDLKLANIFLDHEMNVKLGDFGLAAQLKYNKDKKLTMCGTPNYIAPEILNKNGHSFEVDVWSLGVIIYLLIFGKPPFETDDVKVTYGLISRVSYKIPHAIDRDADEIITSILTANINSRPTMKGLLDMEFYQKFIPKSLPTSVLLRPPIFQNIELATLTTNKIEKTDPNKLLLSLRERIREFIEKAKTITRQISQSRSSVTIMMRSEDPNLNPVFWITKWLDYSDKYGTGYQLNDNSTGVSFNDETLMVLLNDGNNIQYIDVNRNEFFFNVNNIPKELEKKFLLMRFFRQYMLKNLQTAGLNDNIKAQETIARLPFLIQFQKTKNYFLFVLNNGTLQINFFEDHVKLVICPIMGSVTYIDQENINTTLSLKLLQTNGITLDLQTRLKIVDKAIEKMLSPKD